MSMTITGRVWKFGDHINTDYMHPAFGRDEPWETRKRQILHIHQAFTEACAPGDVIVAGKNFGCGSSREGAPANLKRLGIGCVVAESFGRIFFRNCIAVALPVMGCRGVSEMFAEGDRLELDYETGLLKNLTTGQELRGPQADDFVPQGPEGIEPQRFVPGGVRDQVGIFPVRLGYVVVQGVENDGGGERPGGDGAPGMAGGGDVIIEQGAQGTANQVERLEMSELFRRKVIFRALSFFRHIDVDAPSGAQGESHV